MKASEVLDNLKRRFPNEPEYHQAVSEVLGTGLQRTSRIRKEQPDRTSLYSRSYFLLPRNLDG